MEVALWTEIRAAVKNSRKTHTFWGGCSIFLPFMIPAAETLVTVVVIPASRNNNAAANFILITSVSLLLL